jgi:hypothetical protein
MSLCVAWIREAGGSPELMFVTDSTLTRGEKWDHGIKLFEIPQANCLLSFVGSTQRAYTLVLNLMSSIVSDELIDSTTTIEDILEHIVALFTVLVREIVSEIPGEDIHQLRSDAKFLFGGWDWDKGFFRVWKITYSRELEEMVYEELAPDRGTRNFVEYIGDAHTPYDIEERAKEKFVKLMECQGHGMDCALDMEPAKIVRDIVRDPAVREIGGSLQIAKLHRSNKIDFYGIYWPSAEGGTPHFQGRSYNVINKPNVKYYDPDTFEVIEMEIPTNLNGIEMSDYDGYEDFLESCYPKGKLRDGLSDKEREQLKRLFQDVAYRTFLREQEALTGAEGESDEQLDD